MKDKFNVQNRISYNSKFPKTRTHTHTHTASLQRWTVLTKEGRSRYKGRRSGRGPGARLRCIHFFSFPMVSDLIRQRFVVLTVLAARGHLAHDAGCCVSLLSPLPVRPWWVTGNFFFLLGPEQALNDPGDEKRLKGKWEYFCVRERQAGMLLV